MRYAVSLLVLAWSLGCATGKPLLAPPPAPSSTKTLPVAFQDAVRTFTERAQAHHLTLLARQDGATDAVVVLQGPREQRASVSSSARGFTTNGFAFHRRYTVRFAAVDEGHTRVELSTTAEFEDADEGACSSQSWVDAPRPLAWPPSCSTATTQSAGGATVDRTEREWVVNVDAEESQRAVSDLLAQLE